jgi:hypothetical protein
MTGNWTIIKKKNDDLKALLEWIALRPDIKDNTIDKAIEYLGDGDLIYFQCSDNFFVVTLDIRHYEGLCTAVYCDLNLSVYLKAFSDKEILQNAKELTKFLLEACNLFLANAVHES